jgi:4-amino-4-deoxy-L-arabinose transferase-like glycosyltransferase
MTTKSGLKSILNIPAIQKEKKVYAIFTIILLIALFLRLHNLEYMEFKGDEALNSLKALKMAEDGEIPLTSLRSTTGINEPPIFIFLLATPFLFIPNPVGAAAFIALMNLLGILVLFFFMKKFFDVRAALFTAALYAVNPWQILFSRKIWTQNLLAPFVIIFIYLMFNAVYDKKKGHIIPAMIGLGIVVQLHLSAFYIFGVFLLTIIWYRERLNWRYIGIGGILFLLTFTPYIIFQIQNDFVDYHTLLSYSGKKSSFQTEALTLPFLLVTTKGFDYSFGASYTDFENSSSTIPILDFLGVAVLFFAILFLILSYKNRGIILLFWFSLGILLTGFSKSELVNHYFLPLLPLIFILSGNFLSWASRKGTGVIKNGFIGFILLLIAYQFTFDLSLLSFIKNEPCIYGDYGPPFAHRYDRMKKIIEPLDLTEINSKFDEIHLKSCSCVQCYEVATKYTIKLIKLEYHMGPIGENESN